MPWTIQQPKGQHVASAPLLFLPQDCRECCGGMGFLSANKIGPLMTDMNVDGESTGMGRGWCRCPFLRWRQQGVLAQTQGKGPYAGRNADTANGTNMV